MVEKKFQIKDEEVKRIYHNVVGILKEQGVKLDKEKIELGIFDRSIETEEYFSKLTEGFSMDELCENIKDHADSEIRGDEETEEVMLKRDSDGYVVKTFFDPWHYTSLDKESEELGIAGYLGYGLAKIFFYENNQQGKAIKNHMIELEKLEPEVKKELAEYRERIIEYVGDLPDFVKDSMKMIKSEKVLELFLKSQSERIRTQKSKLEEKIKRQEKLGKLAKKMNLDLYEEPLSELKYKKNLFKEMQYKLKNIKRNAKEYINTRNQLNKERYATRQLIEDFAHYVANFVHEEYKRVAHLPEHLQMVRYGLKAENLFNRTENFNQAKEIAMKAKNDRQLKSILGQDSQ